MDICLILGGHGIRLHGLLLLTVGIPAAIWHSKNEFGEQLHRLKIPSILSEFCCTSISPIFNIIGEKENLRLNFA